MLEVRGSASRRQAGGRGIGGQVRRGCCIGVQFRRSRFRVSRESARVRSFVLLLDRRLLCLLLSAACIALTTIIWVESSRNAEQIKRLQAAGNIHKLGASAWEYTQQRSNE